MQTHKRPVCHCRQRVSFCRSIQVEKILAVGTNQKVAGHMISLFPGPHGSCTRSLTPCNSWDASSMVYN